MRLIILLIYLIFNEKRNKEFKILMKCLIKFKRIQLIFHDFFYLYKKILKIINLFRNFLL